MPPFIPDVPYKIQFIFIITFSYVWSTAFIDDYEAPLPPEGTEERATILRWNCLRAIAAIIVFMLSFSYLNPYIDQIFRPYQRFWRMISELTKFYICFIIFFLHQRPVYGRMIWGFLDPSLNKIVGEEMHTYDKNCEFELHNLWDNVDHYFLIHLIDWFLASMVIRDVYILHLWSIMDEFVELSFQHILPHFAECWWDHILMDVILTNTPAIILGMKTVRYFGIKEYDWLGRKGKNSILEWEIFQCHRRFGVFCYMFILLLIHFVGGFFLINAFLIPPKHLFTISRLMLWFAFGNIAMREGYEDVSTWNTHDRKEHPVEGRHRWLAVGILITETTLIFKYREGTGNITYNPTSLFISIPWAMFLGFIGFFWCYLRFKPNRTKKFLENPPQLLQESKKVK